MVHLVQGSQRARPSAPEVRERAAFEFCKGYVQNEVTSPTEARFRTFSPGDGGIVVRDVGGGRYRVTSTVDAPTRSGASIRRSFTCDITKVADSWRLDDLTVEG